MLLIDEDISMVEYYTDIEELGRHTNNALRKTKNPFGTKISMDISFQLLLYIIEVNYWEDQ